MLLALRFCLVGAGEKMAVIIRKQVTPTLVDLLGCGEDSTRTVASGCTGVLCSVLPEEELTDILINNLLGENKSNVAITV